MKLRVVTILFTAFLLIGCAQDSSRDSLESSRISESIESTSDTEGEIVTDNSASTSSADDTSQTSEPEPYYPIFEAITIDGETLTSDLFADSKLTMINVWATYCNPCINEMPDLGEIASEYDPADFQLIGIISDVYEADESSETKEEAEYLFKQTQANYPHLLLNESLYMSLVGGTSAVPTTFFIKQNGELLGYIEGALPKDTWKELINDLLAETE